MNTEPKLQTLDELLTCYAGDNDPPRDVPRIRFEEALQRGDDPIHFLPYLAGLGIEVMNLENLLSINDDQDEDDIAAFRVVEGIAVCIASDGLWMLFETAAP